MPRYEPPHAPGGSSGDSYHDASSDQWPGQQFDRRSDEWRAEGAYPAYPVPAADPWQATADGSGGGFPGDAAPEPMWGAVGTEAPDWASNEPYRPRPPTSNVRRLAVVLAIALLVCGAASVTGYLLVRDEPVPATGAPSPEPVDTPRPSPTGGTPLPQSSTDVRFVVVGQCVRNEGGNDDPKLTITPCGPRTYQVLERFDGATTGKDDARSKCSAVPGYTDWYFFDSPLDVLDYVLCLKSR